MLQIFKALVSRLGTVNGVSEIVHFRGAFSVLCLLLSFIFLPALHQIFPKTFFMLEYPELQCCVKLQHTNNLQILSRLLFFSPHLSVYHCPQGTGNIRVEIWKYYVFR